MKHIVLFTILLISQFTAFASESLKVEGDSLYASGDFAGALLVYESIEEQNLESASLYYNMGNAHYKIGQLAFAILYYERALKLKPNDKDAAYNLELAQQYIVDKVEVVDEFFLTKWFKNFRNNFTSDAWAYLSIISFIVFVLLLTVYTFARRGWLKKISFFIGIFFVLVSFVGMWSASKSKSDQVEIIEAIVFSPTVTVKGSPDEKGTELFILHEGTKVQVIDSVGIWRRIELQDGNVGWIKFEAIKAI